MIELMIAVAILAIVAAIAIPAYNGYIRESRLGAMRMNLDTLRIAVEGYKLDSRDSSYRQAAPSPPYQYTCNASGVCSSTTTDTVYGWRPESSQKGAFSYVVDSPTMTTYNLFALVDNVWVRCQKNPAVTPGFKCCDGTGTSTTACP